MNELIANLKGKLIVSCQAYMGEPLRHPETMAQMARAAELGGAAAIRCQGLSDIAAIKGRVEIPVLGLWKEGHDGVYITPTLRHARACIAAGADVVALDATGRPRPDGRTFEETVAALKGETLVMADCACMDDVRREILSADMVVFATPLYYYGMSAQLKTIIDRFCSANASITGRHMKAALLAVAWNADEWTFEALEAHYRTIVRYLHMEDAGMVLGRGCGTPGMTRRTGYPQAAYDLGASL